MTDFNSLPASFFSFVNENNGKDSNKLLLKFNDKKLDFNLLFALCQIDCRKKAIKKLPSFLVESKFIFPDVLSSEQATDEVVARFHTSLIGKGKKIVDLTAGLGIDSFSLAMAGNIVTAIEIQGDKAAALKFNSQILKLENFEVANMDCLEFIKENNQAEVDCFFIDPARRNESNKRTYKFNDCSPDITLFFKDLLNISEEVYIKASPILDISATIKEFECVSEIYIVSLKGECKEILVHLKKNTSDHPEIIAVDLNSEGKISSFSIPFEKSSPPIIYASEKDILRGSYLYEPNAALMKLHAGGKICERFNVKKLGKNTELYLSEKFVECFPGRIIRIENTLSSRDLKKLKGENFSIVTRNYPLKAEEMRKKIGVGESKENYIYAFKVGINEKPLIVSGKKIEVTD